MIVGGAAINFWFPGERVAKDVDIWVREGTEIPEKRPNIEYSCIPNEIMDMFGDVSYARIDDILTIKLSHLEYDIKWWKHVKDVEFLIQRGARVNNKILDALREHWKQVHGSSKNKLSLYKTKEEFFDDFVEKKYDHDWLHRQVAFNEQPVYVFVLKDGQEVMIDKEKFDKLSHWGKVRMFKEEVAVIALERYLLNEKCSIASVPVAWAMALRKTVTALTKGWASRFMVDNLLEFLDPIPEILPLFEQLSDKANGSMCQPILYERTGFSYCDLIQALGSNFGDHGIRIVQKKNHGFWEEVVFTSEYDGKTFYKTERTGRGDHLLLYRAVRPMTTTIVCYEGVD